MEEGRLGDPPEPRRLQIQSCRTNISVSHLVGLQDPVMMIQSLVDKKMLATTGWLHFDGNLHHKGVSRTRQPFNYYLSTMHKL